MLKLIAFLILMLTILRFDFVVRFDLCLNLYNKVCSFTLYLFSLRVFESRIMHDNEGGAGGTLHLQMGKKHSSIAFSDDDCVNKLREGIPIVVIKDIVEELMITELGTDAKIGDKNALNVTMLMGSAKIAYCSILSFLKTRRTLKSYESFVPFYNEEVFIVDVSGILNISIADIIFIASKVLYRLRHTRDEQISINLKEIN